jgi:predicted lactoylglutathione lyase
VKVYKISGVTLSVENMEKSCNFYSGIPGFKIEYGGSDADSMLPVINDTQVIPLILNTFCATRLELSHLIDSLF